MANFIPGSNQSSGSGEKELSWKPAGVNNGRVARTETYTYYSTNAPVSDRLKLIQEGRPMFISLTDAEGGIVVSDGKITVSGKSNAEKLTIATSVSWLNKAGAKFKVNAGAGRVYDNIPAYGSGDNVGLIVTDPGATDEYDFTLTIPSTGIGADGVVTVIGSADDETDVSINFDVASQAYPVHPEITNWPAQAVPQAGGSVSLSVHAAPNATWEFTEDGEATPIASGTGNGTITLTVPAYSTLVFKAAAEGVGRKLVYNLTYGDGVSDYEEYELGQDAPLGVEVVCSAFQGGTIDSSGGTYQIQISVSENTAPTLVSKVSLGSFSAMAQDPDSGLWETDYTIAQNDTGDPRDATMTITVGQDSEDIPLVQD